MGSRFFSLTIYAFIWYCFIGQATQSPQTEILYAGISQNSPTPVLLSLQDVNSQPNIIFEEIESTETEFTEKEETITSEFLEKRTIASNFLFEKFKQGDNSSKLVFERIQSFTIPLYLAFRSLKVFC